MNWESVTDKNTDHFSFEDETEHVKVLKVYDGDTITIAKQVGERVFKFNCRVLGIDTPEIKTKNKKEKELAIEARDYLRDLILGKVILVKFSKFDKYGRLLIWAYVNDQEDIASLMIEKGYAREYHGGKREPWNL